VLDLSVSLGPLRLGHPIINASGTMELFDVADALSQDLVADPPVAAYVPKTVTLAAREGNTLPRIAETPGGMINAVGLPSPGIDAFVAVELPRLLALPCPLIISVAGFCAEEYVTLGAKIREALEGSGKGSWMKSVGLELNVSCPNVHSGCASIGSDPQETEEVVAAVRSSWPGLLIAKLTPNVTDITLVGVAAEKAGADAISAVNTYKGLVVDRKSLRPRLGNVTGGVSGPAIRPLALRAVYELYEAVGVPIVGMGGVAEVQDVVEFMACGATAVSVGSSAFRDPTRAAWLAEGLAAELSKRGMSVRELVGFAHA